MCGIAGIFAYGVSAGGSEHREPAGGGRARTERNCLHPDGCLSPKGEFEHRPQPDHRQLAALARMVAVLRHRGPDDQGADWVGPIGLGHARLSILDLARGHQPLYSEDRQIAVVCNGEIYNHRALRRELEGKGHRFATHSDTEVIAHLYEELGAGCVERLSGMFALAVADRRERRLLLARDRVGKKPLYYTDDGARLGFASEAKALLAGGLAEPGIDPEALALYLELGYVPAPWSILPGVRKLPAGHLALCDERGLRIERYWDLAFAPPEEMESDPREDERRVDELEAVLGEAVRDRLESDVPLGAFLSGGIDSGLVVSLMSEALDRPVLTHTVGFADRATDEREDAAAVARALHADHWEAEVAPELVDLLPRIAWHFDEPFADPSAVPTWYVARATRERVTVALSGDGGDELFAGYASRYGVHLLEERARRFLPAALRRTAFPPLARRWPRSPALPRPLRLATILDNLAVDADRAYWNDRRLIPRRLSERLFGENRRPFEPFAALTTHLARAPEGDPLARSLYLDFKTWLADDGLVKVDRMSMAHGLEVRCPLLDHRVVELAAKTPSRLKLGCGGSKILLKKLAARRLPAEILARPKRGFAPPVERWLREDLRDLAHDLLLARDSLVAGLCERREVARLLSDHAARRIDAGWAIWTLLMLEEWGRAALPAGRQALSGVRPEPTEVRRAG
jgi:asparagine synthase (glutamine-hydrolysing)